MTFDLGTRKFLNVLILGVAFANAATAVTITADAAETCPGGSIKLRASGAGADGTVWTVSGGSAPSQLDQNTGVGTKLKIASDATGTVTVRAAWPGAPSVDTIITIEAADSCPFANSEVVRALLGFEQVGASGTPSSQNFLFDFFITRPTFTSRLRWWGEVKVASFPQQVNTQLVTFAQQFATTFGNLKVNQLAQTAEFVSGPEFVLTPLNRRFALSLFAAGGATGPNNPSDGVTVFAIPATTSPQYSTLKSLYSGIPNGATNIAFLPQSSDRFLRQYEAGLRLYTFYPKTSTNRLGQLPGSVEFSVGQNEFVTNSHLTGLVGHIAAMHPFTFGDAANGKGVTIYLFGEATMAYTRSTFSSTIPLAPALDSSKSPVPVTDSSVYTVTVPANRRDTYRIGVGIDLVSVFNALWQAK